MGKNTRYGMLAEKVADRLIKKILYESSDKIALTKFIENTWWGKQVEWEAWVRVENDGFLFVNWKRVEDPHSAERGVWFERVKGNLYRSGSGQWDELDMALKALGIKKAGERSYISDWGDGDTDKFTTEYYDFTPIFGNTNESRRRKLREAGERITQQTVTKLAIEALKKIGYENFSGKEGNPYLLRVSVGGYDDQWKIERALSNALHPDNYSLSVRTDSDSLGINHYCVIILPAYTHCNI